MKSRLTHWIAATLLLLIAGVGVPQSRFAAPRLQSSIVRVDRSGEAQREIVEPRKTSSAWPREIAGALPQDEDRAHTAALDRSLFQRPPPAFLL